MAKSQQIKWDSEMRYVLLLLDSSGFVLDEKARVFSEIFSQRLRNTGLNASEIKIRVAAQLSEKKSEKESSRAVWAAVARAPQDPAKAKARQDLENQVEKITQSMGLRLQSKTAATPARAAKTTTTGLLTPPLTSRKREIITIDFDCDADSDSTVGRNRASPLAKRVQTVRISGTVEVPKTPQRIRSHHKVLPASQRVKPTTRSPQRRLVEYSRPQGPPLLVTPEDYAIAQRPLVPVTDKRTAHPPLSGLLFRYWVEGESADHNMDDGGIWARKYYRANCLQPEPPTHDNVCLTDVWNHMNREMKETPFISTSNRLFWIFREAFRKSQKGEANGRITIIDPRRLNPRAIFHAQAYHDAISPQKPFLNGAQRFTGTHEYLVWQNIPRSAIIQTISVQALVGIFRRTPAIAQTLRIDKLLGRASLFNQLLSLKGDGILLDPITVAAIAQIARYLGIRPDSGIEIISCCLENLTRDWALQLPKPPNHARLLQLAEHFASSFCGKGKVSVDVRYAFLNGLRWAVGEFNARIRPLLAAKMSRKAEKVGLENPAGLLIAEMDAAKLRLILTEKRQQTILAGSVSALLLADDETDMREDDAGLGALGPNSDSNEVERGEGHADMDDEDEDEDEDEDSSETAFVEPRSRFSRFTFMGPAESAGEQIQWDDDAEAES